MTYYLSLVAYYIYFNSAKVAYLASLLALSLFYVVLGSAGDRHAPAPPPIAAGGWRFVDQQQLRNLAALYLQLDDGFNPSQLNHQNSNHTYYGQLPSTAAAAGGVAGY
ncbi:unnamed protein product [Linum trigynum]|uniref:Uncharacterized protein n=1 Tax=Linum trigynum TaxID=586398 RepID=A0AAV2GFD6_9ROSI